MVLNRSSNTSGAIRIKLPSPITNHRLLNITPDEVTFSYKDYRQEGVKKVMALSCHDFIRRFSLHILPRGFVRIRHYGILSSSRKIEALPLIYEQLHSQYAPPQKQNTEQIMLALGFNVLCCPQCNELTMITILSFDRRGPPDSDHLIRIREKAFQNRRVDTAQA